MDGDAPFSPIHLLIRRFCAFFSNDPLAIRVDKVKLLLIALAWATTEAGTVTG
jgi:hypothetical protein